MVHIFIVNPFAGQKTFADDLRTKLSKIKGLNYFVFNTRCQGYEQELVRKVQTTFENEKLRFYCCGGSGTMRNMLNGFDDLEKAEVAFFPCGLTNDFLKVFGKYQEKFYEIEELIDGDVITVDYIKTNHGIALNTFSVGWDSTIVNKVEEYRILSIFGKQVPYACATLFALFRARPQEYTLYLDDQKVEGKFAEVFWGNGNILGGKLCFAENAFVTDGQGEYTIGPNVAAFRALPILVALQGRNYEKVRKACKCGHCSKLRLRRKDGAPFTVNFDGELVTGVKEWEAQIVKQGLHLVVPKGVKL